MEEKEKKEDVEIVLPSETEAEKKVGDENEAKGLNRDGSPKQDLLKTELEKIRKQPRSKKEKLLFTQKRVNEQLAELGEGDEPVFEDDEEPEEEDDNKPVTVGMLKKMQKQEATKTALQLAQDIADPSERELTIFHIKNTIRPTGNPQKDLELAQVHVNAVKNTQILNEITRKPIVRTQGGNGGGNPQNGKVEEELTAKELAFMRPPFNLTKAEILQARKQQK